MANGYGSLSNSTITKNDKVKIIKSFVLNLSNIKSSGETRDFTITGDGGSIFTLIIKNNHDHYYNFETNAFSATPNSLQDVIEGGVYKDSIKFPALPDSNSDDYTIYLIASLKDNTKHSTYIEARYADNTIDFNSSKGSDSAVLLKKIYQHADKTITLSATSPNGITAFNTASITTDTVTVSGRTAGQKISFTVVATAGVANNFVINRQPIENDFIAYVERTIGSAPLQITGEDISSSTYYRWPIDNIVGLSAGMNPTGNNISAGTKIADYKTTVEQTFVTKKETLSGSFTTKSYKEDSIVDFVKAIESTGPATVTNGVITSQPGNIIFNQQQVAALADDAVKIYGYGPLAISDLTGYNVKLSNLKVELTAVTTTTTSAVSNSTSVPIAERAGIRDKISTVTGIGVDTSSALPTVASGAGAVNGAGTVVLSAAQTLESGITLTFGGASRIATITGDIEVLNSGPENLTLRIDLEKILTAT